MARLWQKLRAEKLQRSHRHGVPGGAHGEKAGTTMPLPSDGRFHGRSWHEARLWLERMLMSLAEPRGDLADGRGHDKRVGEGEISPR